MTPVGADGRFHPDPIAAAYASIAKGSRSASGESAEFDVENADRFFGELVVDAIGKNEVQKVTIEKAEGGTFQLVHSYENAEEEVVEETTAAIKYNATAAEVQAALEALAGIAVGDVAVTGEAGGPYTVTFKGAYATQNVMALVGVATKLEGEGAEVKVETTQAGGAETTLDVKLETKVGDDWAEVGAFAQKKATDASASKVFGPLGEKCRWKWTLGAGGAAVFAINVKQPAGAS